MTNSSARGLTWSASDILAVWRKGKAVAEYDPAVFRKDACGAFIKYGDYGRETEYGWEIDHIRPVAAGGADDLNNLQPLHWRNNRHKGDRYPQWSCLVTS